MPTPIETTVQGFASCRDTLCPGFTQEKVDVLRREVLFMREEYGGDVPGLDHSTIAAIDASVSECPHCGGPRIAALEERPEYPPISGQDPLALLSLDKQTQIRNVEKGRLEDRLAVAEMRAEFAEREAKRDAEIAEMRAELNRRKGGRPPKDPEGE